MQVCLNGHIINTSYSKYPDNNEDYCSQCGAETIIDCPKCKKKFRGDQYRPTYEKKGQIKNFCDGCGTNFKWSVHSLSIGSSIDSLLPVIDPIHNPIQLIERLLKNFHLAISQLRERHGNKPPIIIEDEYDVQYLLHFLLKAYFEDIEYEEPVPSFATSSSRMDFIISNNGIVIETKIANENHKIPKIINEIIQDITRYKETQN